MTDHSNSIVRHDFGNARIRNLTDELRSIMLAPKYDEVMVCELVGILSILQYEMMERNK